MPGHKESVKMLTPFEKAAHLQSRQVSYIGIITVIAGITVNIFTIGGLFMRNLFFADSFDQALYVFVIIISETFLILIQKVTSTRLGITDCHTCGIAHQTWMA